MAVVFLGPNSGSGVPADPDDDKARNAQTAIEQWDRLLRTDTFVARLPAGAADRLKAAVSKANWDLAVYRGELLKANRSRSAGPVPGLGTTATFNRPMSGNPGTDIAILVAVVAAAIAVTVVVTTNGAFTAARSLDTSLGNLENTSQDVLQDIAPIPLDFSPNITPELLQQLISLGVLVVTGALMAINIEEMKKFLEGIFGKLKAISAAKQKECAAEIAAALVAALRLKGLVDNVAKEQKAGEKVTGGNKLIIARLIRSIMDMFNQVNDAMNALNQCLARGKPN